MNPSYSKIIGSAGGGAANHIEMQQCKRLCDSPNDNSLDRGFPGLWAGAAKACPEFRRYLEFVYPATPAGTSGGVPRGKEFFTREEAAGVGTACCRARNEEAPREATSKSVGTYNCGVLGVRLQSGEEPAGRSIVTDPPGGPDSGADAPVRGSGKTPPSGLPSPASGKVQGAGPSGPMHPVSHRSSADEFPYSYNSSYRRWSRPARISDDQRGNDSRCEGYSVGRPALHRSSKIAACGWAIPWGHWEGGTLVVEH